MLKINLDDTIAAIATPVGEGGIGIVRLSGDKALSIADKIFVSKDGKKASEYETYTTHYGWIVSNMCHARESGHPKQILMDSRLRGNDGGNIIDEVILTVMKAPKSYTKEDIVEINCHGGIVPLKKVLDLVLSMGARLAEPGEFTKRAFLNGRIDLAQAEAVLDIVRAKTEKGLEVALLQLEGDISSSIRGIKEKILDVKVHLEALIDFPEEGLSAYSRDDSRARLDSIRVELESLLKSFETGKLIREGINCVICGKANVGKSSLMNALLKEERVIVTPIPGTTRDAICEYINIDGIPLNIVDTAGISKTQDMLEKEGARRSKLWIDKADLILFMLDAGTGFRDEDKEVVELIKDKESLCILNKIDLDRCVDIEAPDLRKYFGKEIDLVKISVLKKINLEGLLKEISDKIWKGEVFADDSRVLTNIRHKNAVSKALEFVQEADSSLQEGQPEEIIAISLDDAISALGEITGEVVSEEVLERIFSQFCIGK